MYAEPTRRRPLDPPPLEYIVIVDGEETPESPYFDVLLAAFAAQAAKLEDRKRSVSMLVEERPR